MADHINPNVKPLLAILNDPDYSRVVIASPKAVENGENYSLSRLQIIQAMRFPVFLKYIAFKNQMSVGIEDTRWWPCTSKVTLLHGMTMDNTKGVGGLYPLAPLQENIKVPFPKGDAAAMYSLKLPTTMPSEVHEVCMNAVITIGHHFFSENSCEAPYTTINKTFYTCPPVSFVLRAYGYLSHMYAVEMVGILFYSHFTQPFFLGTSNHKEAIALVSATEAELKIRSSKLLLELDPNNIVVSSYRPGIAWTIVPQNGKFCKIIAGDVFAWSEPPPVPAVVPPRSEAAAVASLSATRINTMKSSTAGRARSTTTSASGDFVDKEVRGAGAAKKQFASSTRTPIQTPAGKSSVASARTRVSSLPTTASFKPANTARTGSTSTSTSSSNLGLRSTASVSSTRPSTARGSNINPTCSTAAKSDGPRVTSTSASAKTRQATTITRKIPNTQQEAAAGHAKVHEISEDEADRVADILWEYDLRDQGCSLTAITFAHKLKVYQRYQDIWTASTHSKLTESKPDSDPDLEMHPAFVNARLLYGYMEVVVEMDWVEGVSPLDQEPTGTTRSMKHYLPEIASAILWLARRGLLYIDVKGANVIITPDQQLRLIDYDDCVLLEPPYPSTGTEVAKQLHKNSNFARNYHLREVVAILGGK